MKENSFPIFDAKLSEKRSFSFELEDIDASILNEFFLILSKNYGLQTVSIDNNTTLSFYNEKGGLCQFFTKSIRKCFSGKNIRKENSAILMKIINDRKISVNLSLIRGVLINSIHIFNYLGFYFLESIL